MVSSYLVLSKINKILIQLEYINITTTNKLSVLIIKVVNLGKNDFHSNFQGDKRILIHYINNNNF